MCKNRLANRNIVTQSADTPDDSVPHNAHIQWHNVTKYLAWHEARLCAKQSKPGMKTMWYNVILGTEYSCDKTIKLYKEVV